MLLSNSFRLSTLDLLSFQFFWDVIFSSWVNVSRKSKWIQCLHLQVLSHPWKVPNMGHSCSQLVNSMKEWLAKWEGPLKFIIICSPCQLLVGVNPINGHVRSSAGPAPLPHTRPHAQLSWLPCLSFIAFTNQSNTPMYLQVSPAFGILLEHLNPEKTKTSHPRRPESWLSAFFTNTWQDCSWS